MFLPVLVRLDTIHSMYTVHMDPYIWTYVRTISGIPTAAAGSKTQGKNFSLHWRNKRKTPQNCHIYRIDMNRKCYSSQRRKKWENLRSYPMSFACEWTNSLHIDLTQRQVSIYFCWSLVFPACGQPFTGSARQIYSSILLQTA
jgi:hypothetical protein